MIAAAALLLRSGTIESADADPRIGGMNIGAKFYDNPDYLAALARADWIALDIPRNWQRNGQMTSDVLRRIRQLNPDILISQYVTFSGAMSAPDSA